MRRPRAFTRGLVALLVLVGSVGCSDSGGDAGGDEYLIGAFGPAALPQGPDIRDAALLAADELNKNGGIDGRTVKIIFCDTENGAKPQRGVACATKFAAQDQVDAVVGGATSGETLATLDTLVKAEMLFLSTGAASPEVTADIADDPARKYIFRVGPLNSRALAADTCLTYVTQLARATGYQRFGILYEDTEFARPLVAFLRKCLPAPASATGGAIPVPTGVQVVGVEKHLPDATDFSSQFRSLERARAQYVIEINSRQEGTSLVSQWGRLKPRFALGGINVSSQSAAFFPATGGNGAWELNGPTSITRAPITPKTIPFYDAFRKRFGRDPIYNAASTYDAIQLLGQAADAAGSTETDDLVAELAKTDHNGVQGRIRFDENHDVVYGGGDPKKGLSPIYVQWLPGGTRKIVYPPALAGGTTYQQPGWLR